MHFLLYFTLLTEAITTSAAKKECWSQTNNWRRWSHSVTNCFHRSSPSNRHSTWFWLFHIICLDDYLDESEAKSVIQAITLVKKVIFWLLQSKPRDSLTAVPDPRCSSFNLSFHAIFISDHSSGHHSGFWFRTYGWMRGLIQEIQVAN